MDDDDGLDVFQSTNLNTGLEPCGLCGRKFQPESLQRHYPICLKTSQKRRKVFDSTKQRVEGTGVSAQQAKAALKKKDPAIVEQKKHQWKAKHEDFMNTVRGARGVSKAIASGGPLPPPPKPSSNPDYVQCPTCSRRFKETAAERHIVFCKEQQQRIGSKKDTSAAKAKLAIRTQYKAPRLKGQAGTSTSNNNSASFRQSSNNNSSSIRQQTGSADSRHSVTGPRAPLNNKSAGVSGAGDDVYDPYTTADSQMNNLRKTARGAPSRTQKYQASMYSDEDDAVYETPKGKPMRTGRTQATYDEGKQMRNGTSLDHQQRTKPNLVNRYGSHDSLTRQSPSTINSAFIDSRDGYTPSPPAGGRPPSGSAHVRQRTVKHETESGYYSNSDPDVPKRKGSAAKFCHDCGTRYPVDWAKFCCECGMKRVYIQ